MSCSDSSTRLPDWASGSHVTRLHKVRLHTGLPLLHALTDPLQTLCPWAGLQQGYAVESDSQHHGCCLRALDMH